MTIKTKSSFFFGHEITINFFTIPFNEGAGDLSASLNVGTYSLTDFVIEAERAMNDAGTQTYTVSVDRTTRLITISAGSAFDLLFATGSTSGTSIFALLGFAQSDFVSLTTYTGTLGSGSEYKPQFILQNFVDFDNREDSVESSVNESASGLVEVVSFGKKNVMSTNIIFITDLQQANCLGSVIEDNSIGVSDARDFMEFIVGKGNIEFIPDRDAPSTFTKCLLETTPESREGTSFELKELLGRGLAEYFETGELAFRKVV